MSRRHAYALACVALLAVLSLAIWHERSGDRRREPVRLAAPPVESRAASAAAGDRKPASQALTAVGEFVAPSLADPWREARGAFLDPRRFSSLLQLALSDPSGARLIYADQVISLCATARVLQRRAPAADPSDPQTEIDNACQEVAAMHGELPDLWAKSRAARLSSEDRRLVDAVRTGRIDGRPTDAYALLSFVHAHGDPMATIAAIERLDPAAMAQWLGQPPPPGADSTDAGTAWILAGCEAAGTCALTPGAVRLCRTQGACDGDLRSRLKAVMPADEFAVIEQLSARAAVALRNGDFSAFR